MPFNQALILLIATSMWLCVSSIPNGIQYNSMTREKLRGEYNCNLCGENPYGALVGGFPKLCGCAYNPDRPPSSYYLGALDRTRSNSTFIVGAFLPFVGKLLACDGILNDESSSGFFANGAHWRFGSFNPNYYGRTLQLQNADSNSLPALLWLPWIKNGTINGEKTEQQYPNVYGVQKDNKLLVQAVYSCPLNPIPTPMPTLTPRRPRRRPSRSPRPTRPPTPKPTRPPTPEPTPKTKKSR